MTYEDFKKLVDNLEFYSNSFLEPERAQASLPVAKDFLETVKTLTLENAGLSAMVEEMNQQITMLREPRKILEDDARSFGMALHKEQQSEITRLQRLLKTNGVSYRKPKTKKK